jgi:hypothetical protein
VKTRKPTFYSLQVVSNYWKKIEDGTLWTLKRLKTKGERYAPLYRAENSNFLHILPKDTQTKRLDDYKQLLADETFWESFERDKLAPCFLYEVNFHPFEEPVYESEAHAADPLDAPVRDSAEAEAISVSPAQIIELSLEKIEHRFPGGDNGELGDKDVRDLTATQTFLFQHNYERLNLYRRQTVQEWMRYGLLLFAVWLWWALEAMTAGGFRPLHSLFEGAFAYAGFDIAGAPFIVRMLFSPLTPAVLTLGAFFAMLAWATHIHDLHRLRFVAGTRASSATVAKSLTSRLDNLLYVTRALLEEIDRGKEDAWDQGALKPWASDTQKLAALVFWCDQRIYAIEEFFRIQMKLIGLCNDGIRDAAKFKALILMYRNTASALVLPLLFWVAGTTGLGWSWHDPEQSPAALFDLTCFILVAAGFFALLLRLHGLIKAQEGRESVYNLINWVTTKTMKGYRDSQLYKEIAAFITREKRRLLREEEKRRA